MIVGSYVPEGVPSAVSLQEWAGGATAFYDIDTPVTLAKLARGDEEYLSPALIPGFDLYLSFTGGPTLDLLERRYGARAARALFCSVDPAAYRPMPDAPQRWDLSYLGTYSADRQPALERLLLEPARRAPQRRFVVAGPQYPADIAWPANVERHGARAAGRPSGLLRREPLHAERHPRRHGPRRAQPERAAVRGRRLRQRRSCPTPGTGLDRSSRRARRSPSPRRRRRCSPRPRLAGRDSAAASRGRRAGACSPSTPRRTAPANSSHRGISAHGGKSPRRRREQESPEKIVEPCQAATLGPTLSRTSRRRRTGELAEERQGTPVLVAGGAGFLGSHLCDALLAEGAHVVCVDNFRTGRPETCATCGASRASTLVEADVIDPLPSAASPGCATIAIFNLACAASPPHYQADPEHTMLTNVLGTRNLLRLAEKQRRALPPGLDQRGLWRPGRAIRRPRATAATSTRPGRAPATTKASAPPRR